MIKLNLTLKQKYYHMTGEPGKMYELRRKSRWITSRLIGKDGNPKRYDQVELYIGYQRGRETKLRQYTGFYVFTCKAIVTLPSKERIEMQPGDYLIFLKQPPHKKNKHP